MLKQPFFIITSSSIQKSLFGLYHQKNNIHNSSFNRFHYIRFLILNENLWTKVDKKTAYLTTQIKRVAVDRSKIVQQTIHKIGLQLFFIFSRNVKQAVTTFISFFNTLSSYLLSDNSDKAALIMYHSIFQNRKLKPPIA